MRISKFAKLGFLVVVTFTVLIWGLSYLKGNDIFKSNSVYHVIYDRVEGLVESSEVTLSGYQIGQVKSINFTPDNSGKLIVSFSVDAEINFPVNTLAQIVTSDLMGSRSIEIVLSNESTYYQPNDTLPGTVESGLAEQVSMQVLPIKNKAEQLLGTIDSAITVLTVIFNEDARKNLTESFESLSNTIANVENTTTDLQEIMASEKDNVKQIVSNLEEITTAFNNNTEELEHTLANLSSFSDSLAGISITPVLANITSASDKILSILEKLNSKESTAGLLLNDAELYNSIDALSDNLSYLILDIQTNPKRYLHFSAMDFGKEYYINTSGEGSAKDIIFKVHLVSSENQISKDSKFFEGLTDVEEFKIHNAYTYLIGSTAIYSEIVKLHDSVKQKFPEATIVAFKNGRLIKLKKALRSLQ